MFEHGNDGSNIGVTGELLDVAVLAGNLKLPTAEVPEMFSLVLSLLVTWYFLVLLNRSSSIILSLI